MCVCSIVDDSNDSILPANLRTIATYKHITSNWRQICLLSFRFVPIDMYIKDQLRKWDDVSPCACWCACWCVCVCVLLYTHPDRFVVYKYVDAALFIGENTNGINTISHRIAYSENHDCFVFFRFFCGAFTDVIRLKLARKCTLIRTLEVSLCDFVRMVNISIKNATTSILWMIRKYDI